jgi:hypothetical protein
VDLEGGAGESGMSKTLLTEKEVALYFEKHYWNDFQKYLRGMVESQTITAVEADQLAYDGLIQKFVGMWQKKHKNGQEYALSGLYSTLFTFLEEIGADELLTPIFANDVGEEMSKRGLL